MLGTFLWFSLHTDTIENNNFSINERVEYQNTSLKIHTLIYKCIYTYIDVSTYMCMYIQMRYISQTLKFACNVLIFSLLNQLFSQKLVNTDKKILFILFFYNKAILQINKIFSNNYFVQYKQRHYMVKIKNMYTIWTMYGLYIYAHKVMDVYVTGKIWVNSYGSQQC